MEEKPTRRKYARKSMKMSREKVKFAKLKALNCFEEVERRIVSGWTPTRVADYIQKECAEYQEVSRQSLVKTLTRYREQEAKTKLLAEKMPEVVNRYAEEAGEALDEIKELARLYNIQMARIEREAILEEKIGKLFKTLGNEIFYAMRLVEASAKIKKDFGLAATAQDTNNNINILNMDFSQKYGSESVQKVLQDPASRRKVLGLVEQISKIPEEKRDKVLAIDDTTGLPKGDIGKESIVEVDYEEVG